MSHEDGRIDTHEELNLESGLEALRRSPEFRGPVESLDDRTRSNGHFALVYESREEQFAAAVPFVRQGLDRGERCLYIADENSRAEVLEAMRIRGIDVDTAFESGALSIHTEQDTYRNDGTFDPDDVISFLEDAIDEAIEEYEGLRITGEMTWILGDEPNVEDLVEYEAKLNSLFPGTDSLALCQYNRERFPAEVVRDIVKTHPHLIYDNTVCHNFYYTPPEEFFGPERPDQEVDRMMRTLQERTEAKVELQEHERYLREFYEITADSERSFDEKLDRLLDLGRDRFDLGKAFLLEKRDDEFRVVRSRGTDFEDGVTTLSTRPGQYCEQTTTGDAPIGVEDARRVGWSDDPLYEEYDLGCYFSGKVTDETGLYGTMCFADSASRERPFTDTEYTFLDLLGQWLSYELEREGRERYLREQNEITADADRSFEEKLQAMFELGCERFDLELGAMARVDPETDRFEIEYTSDDHAHFEPGVELPLSETYCTAVIESEKPASVSDPIEGGYEEITVYQEFGLRTYMGAYVEIDGGPDRTFFFVSSEPRDAAFSEVERTFHQLMGEWVKYELERVHREEQLQRKNDRLESFASMLAHELRNPVAIGQIYSRQLQNDADSESVDLVTEAFDRIENIIDVMLMLTNGQEAVGEKTAVRLAAVAREAWNDVDAPEATLEVRTDHTIQADEMYVRHLFKNLLENAVEHAGDAVTVTIGDLEDGFYVADDGSGIPGEHRDAVFDAGFTTAVETGGTGLGLALVQELVKVYDWDRTVTESSDGGARFEFRT